MLRRKAPVKSQAELPPDTKVISTGSTLLDLAISGGRFPTGGLPGGILVEIFGPTSTGKTVLLSEIAGNVQRTKGEVRFYDPEGRLNKQFARLFGLDIDTANYSTPATIAEVFRPLRKWTPDPEQGPHGVFADSLTALTTEFSMEDKDAYGMRRAKEFSEELRHVCRILGERNILLVCSNQIRQNLDAGYGPRYKSPGGEAIGFYSSVRLRTIQKKKTKVTRKVRGKEHSTITGVEIEVEVFKSSVWAPYHRAEVHIGFDYGIDDVRANLQYLKTNTGDSVYRIGDTRLRASLDRSAAAVEEQKLETKLKKEVIGLWREIQKAFSTTRQKRRPD